MDYLTLPAVGASTNISAVSNIGNHHTDRTIALNLQRENAFIF
jgi:hypothetical protein